MAARSLMIWKHNIFNVLCMLWSVLDDWGFVIYCDNELFVIRRML